MGAHVKKHIAMLLSVCLILGTFVPIPVSGAGETVSVVLSNAYLVKSTEAQTVQMYVRVNPAVDAESFNYTVVTDDPLYVSAVSANGDTNNLKSVSGGQENITQTAEYTQLGSVTFTVPANASGEFELGISGCELYSGTSYLFRDRTAFAALTIVNDASELPAQGRTATLSGPASAFTGGANDTVTYTINITGDAYQSAELKLAYDSTRLEFDTAANPKTMTAKNGVVTIVQYGENQTPSYSIKFKTIKTGTATVTLTSAAFGTSNTAVSGDLTPAYIGVASVSTLINNASFTVTLPEEATGDASVSYGETYTFTPALTEPTKYEYAVNATMDGQPVDVTNNRDGTYSIASVTGDLVITVTKTPKKYTITFKTTTVKVPLPVDGEVTYGVPYTFTTPGETGCALAITSATIGGQNYTCDPVSGTVTIPGDVIVGNIIITIERVSATVTVNGTGAADAKGAATAAINSDYTLTLNKDASYRYTVTATMDGAAVTPTVNENTYTIKNVTGPIVFQINKTINSAVVGASQYIALDGSAVWLVKNAVNKLSGSVYTYNNTKMIWSDAYKAYCCLVISAVKPEVSNDNLKLIPGTTDELDYSLNVNQSQKVDANDAQLIYDLYNGKYNDFSVVTMDKFLLADTNQNGKVDTNDVVMVVNDIVK